MPLQVFSVLKSELSQAKVLVLCSLETYLTLTLSPYSQEDTVVYVLTSISHQLILLVTF